MSLGEGTGITTFGAGTGVTKMAPIISAPYPASWLADHA